MQTEIEKYVESVRRLCPGIRQNELSQFASRLRSKHLKKKDYFIQADKVQNLIGFITAGLVRAFYVDNHGNEITVGFYPEGTYATHYPAFITQRPSKYFIQCLEPTDLVCLSFEDLQWIYQHLEGFERYGRLVVEEILQRQQARIESFIFQSAEERYLEFIERYPNLFNRISLSHLCSYLGIERQSLTRIRQKLSHK